MMIFLACPWSGDDTARDAGGEAYGRVGEVREQMSMSSGGGRETKNVAAVDGC